MRIRFWQAAAGACALLALVSDASAALLGVGKTAPSWTGKTVQGKSLGSAQLKGKVLLINYFSKY